MGEADEHPKMLYRKGSSLTYKGFDLDSLQVNSKEEEQEAKRKGYNDPESTVKRLRRNK